MITDPKFNELRGALQTLNSLIENTSIDDPAIERLLDLQHDVSSQFAKYANTRAEELEEKMTVLLEKVERDYADLKNGQSQIISNVLTGVVSGIAKILL